MHDQPERDAYRVLQVDPEADQIVVRAAYLALMRRYHPDAESPDAARVAEINRAYDKIRDPARRRVYDIRRRQLQPTGPGWAPAAKAGQAPVGPGWGDTRLDFGRYAGWRLADLARYDPDYLRWLSRHSAGVRFRQQIRSLLPDEVDLDRPTSSIG